MAVIREDVIVSPSVDTMSDLELSSTVIEPGIYTLNASKTILGQTSTRWTVICLANNDALSPECYTQLWIPAQSNLSGADQKIYIRTIDSLGTGYGSFTAVGSGTSNAVENESSYPAELYIQGIAPTTEVGKNKIWIDTSS